VNSRTRGYIYVAGQFLLLFVLFTAPRQANPYGPLSDLLSYAGIALMFAGVIVLVMSFINLGRSLTANPVPKEKAELVTTGIYARVRHPIYFALLLLAFGVVLDAGWWPQSIIAGMLYIQLQIKATFEESLLRKKYPAYASYASKTPMFIPRLSK
jgi:protein-S-isoprenylcysteine O-methyltransferase Ste14